MDSQEGLDFDDRHPILRGEYAIFTAPIDEMIQTIGNWIDLRVTGGYIYGPSRYGKSKTIKWFLFSLLEERFGTRVPLVVWIRRDSSITEREFWNDLLEAANYEFYDPLKPKSRTVGRYLFTERLYTMALSSRRSFVTLLIDEAHEVTLKEWKWLLGLQNALDARGVRLCVISIGSHGILFQPNYLARTGNAHITARFFSQDMRFRGLRSSKELEFVLNGYDLDSEWPAESGITYLQYFAPDYFKKWKRLAAYSTDIWDAFVKLTPDDVKKQKNYKPEIGMKHVAETVETILRRLKNGEDWDALTDKGELLRVVASTKFTDYMRTVMAKQ